jgi:hypothetical protein
VLLLEALAHVNAVGYAVGVRDDQRGPVVGLGLPQGALDAMDGDGAVEIRAVEGTLTRVIADATVHRLMFTTHLLVAPTAGGVPLFVSPSLAPPSLGSM